MSEALALHGLGRETEARQTVERCESVASRFLIMKKYDEHFNHWILAFCARFLGPKEEGWLKQDFKSSIPINKVPTASNEDAKDLVQGFFLHLLDRKVLAQVDPLKGKFRSFLLASIQNHLSKESDGGRCLKRGGNIEFIPFDPENAEALYLLEAANGLTPETIFDARWATTLLDQVMNRLGREYEAQGKSATFLVLKPFLDPKNAIRAK